MRNRRPARWMMFCLFLTPIVPLLTPHPAPAQLFRSLFPNCQQPAPCPPQSGGLLPVPNYGGTVSPGAPGAVQGQPGAGQPGTPGDGSASAPGSQTNPADTQSMLAGMGNPSFGGEGGLASEGQSFAAPFMIGNLLDSNRSINFQYNRAAGRTNVINNGSTSIVNPSVADDNSPIPTDRVSFRFNYFNNAQSVTGFGAPVVNGQTNIGSAFAQTKDYDVERYTFSLEKTILNGLMSAEVRIPFSSGLSNNLNLSAGDITGPAPGGFNVNTTPGQTLGSDNTQFDNISVIFKTLLYRNDTLAVSGGVSLGVPTGADTTVLITDYSGFITSGTANLQRERLVHIDNETWSLTPFLAGLWTPNDRFFTQGFLQFDFPLNPSTINYSEVNTQGPATAPTLPAGVAAYPTLSTPFSVKSSTSEQTLVHVDLGGGYWLVRDPSRTWLTGVAPTLELHYTGTLNNASVATLPDDNFLQLDPVTQKLVQAQPIRVGNLNNRINILDLTAATTFTFGERTSLAAGFSVPMLNYPDRTFDWEFHLQFNYVFGAGSRRGALNF